MNLIFDEAFLISELDYLTKIQNLINISMDIEYCRSLAANNTPAILNKMDDTNILNQSSQSTRD